MNERLFQPKVGEHYRFYPPSGGDPAEVRVTGFNDDGLVKILFLEDCEDRYYISQKKGSTYEVDRAHIKPIR